MNLINIPLAIHPPLAQTLLMLDQYVVEKTDGRPLLGARTAYLRGNVCVIPIQSPILNGSAAEFLSFWGFTSLEVVAKDLQKALDNPQVKSVLLHFDSPGGTVNGIHELANQIAEATRVKPVVSYVSGLCCSGAYWLASPTRIFIDKTAIVGSIGVLQTFVKTGVEEIVIVSSNAPNKDIDPETDAGVKQIRETLDGLETVFIESVAKHRNLSPATVRAEFGKGGVFVGENALHMVDGLSSLENVIALLNRGGEKMNESLVTKADLQAILAEVLQAQQAAFKTEIEAVHQSYQTQLTAMQQQQTEAQRKEQERLQTIQNLFALFQQEPPPFQSHYHALKAECLGDPTVTYEVARQKLLALRQTLASAQPITPVAGSPTHFMAPPPSEPTYDELMAEGLKAGKTRSETVRWIATQHPAVHAAFLKQVNQGGGEEHV